MDNGAIRDYTSTLCKKVYQSGFSFGDGAKVEVSDPNPDHPIYG